MPEFTDDERDRIRERLLAAGRDRFAAYGLSKTTVAELADAAGIATGTFYSFFDSKERLYLELLEAELTGTFDRIVEETLEAEPTPERAVRSFLAATFEAIEENALVRQAIEGGDRDRLVAATTDADRAVNRRRTLGLLVPYVREWQAAGRIRDGDPETIAFAIESVALLALHAEEFDDRETYEAVRTALAELVAAGLTA